MVELPMQVTVMVVGLEVKATVNHFHVQEPSVAADNPDDYWGYIDCEYVVDSVTCNGEHVADAEWQLMPRVQAEAKKRIQKKMLDKIAEAKNEHSV